jgi:hypothetical protein
MTPAITLGQALTDPALFGKTFASPSFWTWRTVAKLIDGEPLSEPREVELVEQCTGRKYNRQAQRPVRRLILLAGRRAGKDRFFSAVAVWRAALCTNWRVHISAGEGAVTILLGADKKQAAILRGYLPRFAAGAAAACRGHPLDRRADRIQERGLAGDHHK